MESEHSMAHFADAGCVSELDDVIIYGEGVVG